MPPAAEREQRLLGGIGETMPVPAGRISKSGVEPVTVEIYRSCGEAGLKRGKHLKPETREFLPVHAREQ